MNDLCTERLDLHKAAVLENSCEPFNLVYLNDVTEHHRRYELVEWKMELANSSLPKGKSQFQFQF